MHTLRLVCMSVSAWASACAAQAARTTESLEQSSYGSNAFTVRHPAARFLAIIFCRLSFISLIIISDESPYASFPFCHSIRLQNTMPKSHSCASYQIASFSVSFLVSAYWLLLWIRYNRLSRPSLVESFHSSSSDQAYRSPEKIWSHFGIFTALVCAGEPHSCKRRWIRAGPRCCDLSTSARLIFCAAGSLSGIIAWSFNIRS